MGLEKLLVKKRDAIVTEWFDLVAKTYAPDTAQFLKKNTDPFTNPMGGYLSKGLTGLFDQLITGLDRETVRPLLDPIVRVRAIQSFSPSKAVAFVLVVKKIVRKHLAIDFNNKRLSKELLEFEDRVDALSLFAFDIYIQCREKIFELKANEEKERVFKAFKRAGLIQEVPEKDTVL
jgi:hypothetical protein